LAALLIHRACTPKKAPTMGLLNCFRKTGLL